MSDTYYGGSNSRRTLVFVGIIGLHVAFYFALVAGLHRDAIDMLADVGIIDLPPPPPPPEDLDEPPRRRPSTARRRWCRRR